jgi:hypothetical protein
MPFHFAINHPRSVTSDLQLVLSKLQPLIANGCAICKRQWDETAEDLHVYYRSIENFTLPGLVSAMEWRRERNELPDGTSIILVDRRACVCDICWEEFLLQAREKLNAERDEV